MDSFNIVNNNILEKPVLVRSLTIIPCRRCQLNLRDGYNIINHKKKECDDYLIKYQQIIDSNNYKLQMLK